ITERKQAEIALQQRQEANRSLLHLSKNLEQATTYNQILQFVLAEVNRVIGYRNIWIYLIDETGEYVYPLTLFGEATEIVKTTFPSFRVKDDPFIEYIVNTTDIDIVEDARIDPITNKDIVARMGNRTIVHIPLFLVDRTMGMLGTGSFGDEGVRVPTQSEQEYLKSIGSHVAVALIRIQYLEERRRAEEELNALNAALEQRVITRTAELAAANEQLKELDRLKSKFVSDVSHELRAPLTSMGLYLDLLKRSEEGARKEHYLGVLRQQFGRLEQLVENILDLSRLERDSVNQVFTAVALNVIVAEVANVHRPRAEAAGLTMMVDMEPMLPSIQGVPGQLMQVATNLLANAINYTKSGEVRVKTYYEADKRQICLQVEDTGLGIAPEDMPRLFDRFYRGSMPGQSKIPGTGLGLAIVREIVELHRGSIQVYSRPGEGSVFRICLPVSDSLL
ncbi:MAG: GAF domain-containing protein, partial [Anaerolineales bacterium]|nr:GAF domain-containing protein [Anaerolineales bacterium]